jgi:hypothetical protein
VMRCWAVVLIKQARAVSLASEIARRGGHWMDGCIGWMHCMDGCIERMRVDGWERMEGRRRRAPRWTM